MFDLVINFHNQFFKEFILSAFNSETEFDRYNCIQGQN
jgi:hypothetical protein